MLIRKVLMLISVVGFTAAFANADQVYVVTSTPQFGTVDLTTGAFDPIGPNLPESGTGLVTGPGGSLLTLGASGNLDAINPATGVASVVGATGLADCSTPMSPCGPTSANALGELDGTIYATDFQQDLYQVNRLTGQAKLIGPTGIPPVTFIPFASPNPDGSFNLYGGGLFSADGKLYATFDTGTVNFGTGVITPVIPDDLYQIDPSTGHATLIAPTSFALDAVAEVNGTIFAFKNNTGELVTLNLANGGTNLLGDFDQADAGLVFGAAPVPEPGYFAVITAIGAMLVGIAKLRRRKRAETADVR